MNILDTLGYGGIVAIIGMLIVFTGLIILIVAISIMGMFFKTGKKKEKAAPAPAPVAAPAPVVEEAVAEEAPVENDAQLIAVIAAALAAFDGGNKRLVVRKVRRVSGWQEAARSENLYHL